MNRGIVGSFLLWVSVSCTFAQLPTGTISGIVRDSSGAAIPGTEITAANRETGLTRTTPTGADGRFKLAALPVGVYDVKAQAASFKPEIQQNLSLAVGQEAVLNFTLAVGAVQETVTVTAAAPLVETTSGSLGGLVDGQRVTDLPLNGRNFNDLVLLQTGITIAKPVSTTASSAIGLLFSSNGAPLRSNSMLLDGASLAGTSGLNGGTVSGSMLGVEGIREFRVITNSFSAEYGMTMGSQMTIATKGGTNQFHGSAFEFLRNSALDARDFFDRKLHSDDPRIPPFRRNNFGGAFGGPVRKGKSFFFVTYEGVRESKGVTQVLATPTAAARQNGFLVPVVNPAVRPYLDLYPLPTEPQPTDPTGASGVGRFTYVFQRPVRVSYGQARVDHNFSERDSAFVRYTIDDQNLPDASNFPQFTTVRFSRNQFLTVAENHTFSPALLNQFRFSSSRVYLSNFPAFEGSAGDVSLGFIRGASSQMGSITPGSGITQIGSSNISPSLMRQNLYTFSEDLFWIRGAHAVKFGTLINSFRPWAGTSSTNSRGSYTFSNLTQFLLGVPSQFVILTPGSDTSQTFHWGTFGFYIQDDWRAASNFTLNLGFRYEFSNTVNEVTNHGSALVDVIHGKDYTLTPVLFKNPSLRNWGPRLGFAWDIRGRNTTSLRGGFGLLYDLSTFATMGSQQSSQHPPFSSTSRVNTIPGAPLGFPYTTIPPGAAGKSLRVIDFSNLQQPHMLQYNLTLERQLPGSMKLAVSYAGSRGINLYQSREGNPNIPLGIPQNGTCVPLPAGQASDIAKPNCWLGNEPRQNPYWDTMDLKTAGGDSWYNSFQWTLQNRISHGLQFQSSYTWSKALDTAQGESSGESGGTSITGRDPFHPGLDKGPADFDVRQSWSFNALYHVPSMNLRSLGKVLDGWRLSTILQVRTGLAFSPLLSGNRSRSGVFASAAAEPDRPDLIPGRKPGDIILGGPDKYFDPAAFTVPAAGFLGTASRNFLQGPGQTNWNLSLIKDTSLPFLGEAGRVEFRAEFFNLLNRANFFIPVNGRTVFTADQTRASTTPLPTAGQIDRTVSSSRQIQFGLKFLF